MFEIWLCILVAVLITWLIALSTHPLETAIMSENQTLTAAQTVATILRDLEGNPPKTLADAGEKLSALTAALRASADEVWNNSDDKAAVLGNVTLRLEGATAASEALAIVQKAENAAKAALTKVTGLLWAERFTARVWRKLMPTA